MPAYGRLCTAFYDLDKPVAPAAELAFWRDRARHAAGPVLEPMCGSGRFLLPLLGDGVDVEGVDASPEMLAACRRHAAALGLAPVLHEQPLEALALPRRFALAFVAAGSIGLLHTPATLDAALARLRGHVTRGGTLVVEIDEPGSLPLDEPGSLPLDSTGERVVHAPDGTTIHYAARARADDGGRIVRYDCAYERRRGERVLEREAESLAIALHPRDEFAQRLVRAGFDDVRVVADAPVTAGSVMLEARAATQRGG